MTDSTIFNSGDNQNTQTTTPDSQTTNLVEALVGDGRKYKSVEELAKAYTSADDFIEQLKTENAELRNAAAAGKTVDDILEQLNKNGQKPPETPPGNAGQGSKSTGAAATAEDIARIVRETVTGLETQKAQESNLLKADRLMKEKFGDDAKKVFADTAVNATLRTAYMNLAAVDPEKFVNLFAPKQQQQSTQSDSNSTVNTASNFNNPNAVNVEGTKEYFTNIRRTNPTLYYSQDFQVKMDKLVRENPSKYGVNI